MKINVIGTRQLDFDTKDGSKIKGTQIYAIYPSDDKYVIGSKVLLKEDNYKNKKLPFVPESVCASVVLGEYECTFDINGSISTFVRCK